MSDTQAAVQLFDTHLHLDTGESPGLLFEEAGKVGVTRFLLAGTELANSRYVADVAVHEESVVASAGVHPHEASHFDRMEPFAELYERSVVVAVGEIGLDYHYNHSAPEAQRRVFQTFLEEARRCCLPAIVHCREAFADCLAILDEVMSDGGTFEVHSFTGTPAQAERILAMGGYLSFNGMVTFRNAGNIRNALAVVPFERLLLETDAPWLAPVPFRGTPNTPAYLVHTARTIAELRHIPLAELAVRTTANAMSLFGLAG